MTSQVPSAQSACEPGGAESPAAQVSSHTVPLGKGGPSGQCSAPKSGASGDVVQGSAGRAQMPSPVTRSL